MIERLNKIFYKIAGGTTLHAFAGIGDGSGSVQNLCDKALKFPLVAQKWRKCKHLIIDEISMVDGSYFEVYCSCIL